MKHRFQKTTILWLSLCTLLCTSGLTACESKPEPIKDYIIAETETPTEPDVLQDEPVLPYENNTETKNTTAPKSTEKETTQEHQSVPIQAPVSEPNTPSPSNPQTHTTDDGYRLIEVDSGNQNGHREANVKVDIGYGDRVYWAYTNEHGQLVKVTADEIILQNDTTEPVTSDGRYYHDEAKVPGVEQKDLDEGHIIADSLGGVSNAYNITPQNSTLNRHGDQAYMEKVIRDAGGCTNFTAIITYPNTDTQIPSHYDYTYTLNGNVIHDSFDNVNPDNTQTETSKTNKPSSFQGIKPHQPQYADDQTVYYTPNGKSYHSTPNCSTLSRSKTILEGPLSQSGKKDACDRCVK